MKNFSFICKNFGFTLAEVLITLGIIGVVAALTIPNLIQRYQAKVLRAKFLQANTILQEGILRMRNDEVDLDEVINKRNSEMIAKYFESGNCALPKNEEEAGYYNYFGTRKAADAQASDLIQPYCLKNGMLLWFGIMRKKNEDHVSWSETSKYSLLAIDINGWKNKPDRYGQDVFFWYLEPDNNSIKPVGSFSDFADSWYYTQCPGNGTAEAGIGCTVKAISDPEYFKNIKFSK